MKYIRQHHPDQGRQQLPAPAPNVTEMTDNRRHRGQEIRSEPADDQTKSIFAVNQSLMFWNPG
jgi:hypothetical protein